MAIEIVDFPIKNGGSFHGKMLVHQRVRLTDGCNFVIDVIVYWWSMYKSTLASLASLRHLGFVCESQKNSQLNRREPIFRNFLSRPMKVEIPIDCVSHTSMKGINC